MVVVELVVLVVTVVVVVGATVVVVVELVVGATVDVLVELVVGAMFYGWGQNGGLVFLFHALGALRSQSVRLLSHTQQAPLCRLQGSSFFMNKLVAARTTATPLSAPLALVSSSRASSSGGRRAAATAT